MTDSPKVFDAYSRYYDLLYRDKDYEREVEYIRSLLYQHGLAEGDLLEFGAGTGKHGRLLAGRGYRVHGIERSAEMVAQAMTTEGFTVQQGNICDVKLGKTYDAVLSLFHVVSYLTTNAELCAVFSRAVDHLRPGGLFVFDFWYSPAVYAQRPAVRVKRIADGTSEIMRIAEPTLHPNENRVDVAYTVFAKEVATGHVAVLEEIHPMRHFSLPEIDLLAGAHGLVRLGAEEFLSRQAPSEGTWGVCVVLQKA